MATLSLDEVFSPSTPITVEKFFIGRYRELQAMLLCAAEPGKHILLYGERGVGKTSLANMLIAKTKEQKVVKKSAYPGTDFSEIWITLLEEVLGAKALQKHLLPLFNKKSGKGEKDEREAEREELSLYPKLYAGHSKLTPVNLIAALNELGENLKKESNGKITFIIDEFDMLAEKKEARVQFASLIKNLSDNFPHITLILIGIAGRSADLIEQHVSLERCLLDFHLPLMKDSEIADLIESGARKAGFNIHPLALNKIVAFSAGYPYYAHMLAKFSCLHAKKMNYSTVTEMNFTEGLKMATLGLHSLINKQITKATHVRNPNYQHIVMASVQLLQQDENVAEQSKESFTVNELEHYLKRKNQPHKNIVYYLKKLCSHTRGELLQKIYDEKGEASFRFKNPLVKNYLQSKKTL